MKRRSWAPPVVWAASVVVIAALIANTSSINEADAVTERAVDAVEEWIDDRDYEILAVDVDGVDATIVLSGPSSPDDLDDLGDALERVLQGQGSIDVRIAVTEQTTLTPEG